MLDASVVRIPYIYYQNVIFPIARHYQSYNVVRGVDDESGVDRYGRTPLAVRVDD